VLSDDVFSQVAPTPTNYQRYDGQDGVWYTADFSGNGDVTAAAQAVDFTEPTTTPSASTSGCEPSDFNAATTGKIVLLQRGTCDFGLKVENAQAAGAVGAVLFNEGTIGAPDRNDVLIPTLQGYDVTIPAVGTDYATGKALVDQAASGVTLRVRVDGIINEDVTTNNVIAESRKGRSDRTVVVGDDVGNILLKPLFVLFPHHFFVEGLAVLLLPLGIDGALQRVRGFFFRSCRSLGLGV